MGCGVYENKVGAGFRGFKEILEEKFYVSLADFPCADGDFSVDRPSLDEGSSVLPRLGAGMTW